MALNVQKLQGLFSRVYNNQMVKDTANNIDDEADIREYCSKVFGDGSTNPDPSMLHQFNNLIVQQADEVAKPMIREVISLFADYTPKNRGDVVKIEYPNRVKTKHHWSANGSGVDLVRVSPTATYEIAVPKTFATGVYYEPLDMAQDSVANFRVAVNDIAEAKARLYLEQINALIASSIVSGKIPTANVASGNNLDLADFNTVVTTLARYGGRPIFVADMLLIDYFATQQVTDAYYKTILTENLKSSLLTELVPTQIGRAMAVNLYNPFTDKTNSKVDLPVNIGYFYAGTANKKPFQIIEFGGMRQMTEQDVEDERIKLKIVQDADIRLMAGETFGYVKEDSLSL